MKSARIQGVRVSVCMYVAEVKGERDERERQGPEGEGNSVKSGKPVELQIYRGSFREYLDYFISRPMKMCN